jgi:acetyl-CoA acetyltransferase
LEDVAASRMVAKPLTLLQCCAPADGAGALLLAGSDAVPAADRRHAVRLIGLGLASGDRNEVRLTSFPEDARAAQQAYQEASVGPEDVDVAEVHDAFSISQVIHLEDLGLAERGAGWQHALEPNGRLVVNAFGGLLSRGHPLGATGVAQFDSIRRYLLDKNVPASRRRFGLVQEPGGLRSLGQILSTCAVLAAPDQRK